MIVRSEKDDLFPTTRWQDISVLQRGGPEAYEALERICEAYWFPVYAYIRGRSTDPEQARDLAQGFFEHLLERETLAKVRLEGGRFRSVLLTSCRNFLTDVRRFEGRQVRRPLGGWVNLEISELEERYSGSAGGMDSPERAFDRQWALALMDRAFAAVEADYRGRGRPDIFAQLCGYLNEDPDVPSHRESALKLGMTETAVKAELHRLRRRLREALRIEVMETVSNRSEVEDELSLLLAALASG